MPSLDRDGQSPDCHPPHNQPVSTADAAPDFGRLPGAGATPQNGAPGCQPPYTPTQEDLDTINQGLSGWEGLLGVLAPSYYPRQEVKADLYEFIHNNQPILMPGLNVMVQAKAEIANTNALITGGSLRPPEAFMSDCLKFVVELKSEIASIDEFLTRRFHFSRREIDIFHAFVAETAPILYNMGFPDAIYHSGQVSRLCVIEAARQKANRSELMQAAMVGWLHDPKLETHLSWSNLAAHPLIASAIAHRVLRLPVIQEKLTEWMPDLPPGDAMELRLFCRGIENALSINNDSRFVLENVILHKPKAEAGRYVEPGVGLVERLTEPKQRQALEEVSRQRYEASALQEPPQALSPALQTLLGSLPFETGLRGISLSALRRVFALDSDQAAWDLYWNIVRSQHPEEAPLRELSRLLQEDPSLVVSAKVSALRLFSHHDELEIGKKAALSLAIADPLLLSPHKLLETGNHETALERMVSFMTSFSENIRHLPYKARNNGTLWQRDLLLSILKTADALTRKRLTWDFIQRTQEQNATLDEQIQMLERMISDPESWVSPDHTLDYATLTPGNTLFDKLLRSLKEQYEDAANMSPALFGFSARD